MALSRLGEKLSFFIAVVGVHAVSPGDEVAGKVEFNGGGGGLVVGAVEAAAEGIMAEGYVGGFGCEGVILNKVEGMKGLLDIVLT